MCGFFRSKNFIKRWQVVPKPDDHEHVGREPEQDNVEKHEGSQVEDDVGQHHHDSSHGVEDSQVEEGFDDEIDNQVAHEHLAGHRSWAEPLVWHVLKHDVGDTGDIVNYVDFVG